MNIEMTSHGKIRAQQRCIPPVILDWLMTYGAQENSRNCEILYFSKKSRKELQKIFGCQFMKCVSKFLEVYAVVNEVGVVVTTGYRYKPIKREFGKRGRLN